MKAPVEFLTLLLVAISIFYPVLSATLVDYLGDHRMRRILHHPLFPADPPAPPVQTPLPPTPTTAAQNPQFFPHTLPRPPSNQTRTVSPSSDASDKNRADTSDQRKIKPAGKIFIAVSVSIVALGVLIALTCFFYYRQRRNSDESDKLVGQGAAVKRLSIEANRIRRPAMSAASRFLYIGTVEPSKDRSGEIKNSPYRRLNESHVKLGLYQTSPQLEPLALLSGPPQWSPSATFSPDEEDSYYSAKATLTGSNCSPGRLALQQRFHISTNTTTTTTTTTTNRSSTSTNNSINTNTSSDGTMVQSRYGRFSAERWPTESRDTALRIDIASSPTLQPMTVTDLLHSPQHDMSSPPFGRSNLSLPLSSAASSPPPFPIHTLPSTCSEKFCRPELPPPVPFVPSSQTQLPPPISRQQQPPPPPLRPSQTPPPPPPPPPPLSQTPPAPPPPPPRPTQTPPPLLSRSLSRPQHLILNNDRLPEPCPPPMAAHLRNQVFFPEARGFNNPNTEPMGQTPATNVDNDAFPDREGDNSRPKLKPLHWDKVRANSDHAMVWDRLKSSSFTLDEDMIETLFICKPSNSSQKESLKKVVPPTERDTRVLDPKKSQNIAILLRALNVSRDEVCGALLEGNPEGLGVEYLETLSRMAPTKEEELRLKEYCGDMSKLGPAERLLKAILDIPFAFKRIDALLYVANFESEVKYLMKSFETLEAACEELRSSRLFLRLLEAVLKAGNRMNTGTRRGDAEAFKLDTLLKLIDIKGTDGKTTLLHFVVQEIIKSEGQGVDSNEKHQKSELNVENNLSKVRSCGNQQNFKKTGLRVVSGLSNELSHVKKAAAMDSDILSSYLSKLAAGLEKIKSVILLEDSQRNREGYNRKFCDSMKQFVDKAEMEILRVKAGESVALSLVKETTEYFHGDAAKEESHPFRIFMIVRDFLSLLDKICKEVGTMQEKAIMGSARTFLVSETDSLPVFTRFQRSGSSDDESSSS